MFLRALALCLISTPLFATQIRFVPVAERVGRADIVVVGTVTELEAEPLEINLYGRDKKTRVRVAKVKIEDNLLGAAGLTQLRVAFTGAEDQPKDGLKIPTPVLEKDNKVLLFLRQVKGADVVWVDGHYGAIGKTPTTPYLRGDLATEVAEAKPLCKIMAEPLKALQSEKAHERMLASWMLVARYQARPMGPGFASGQTELIPADESKRIMEGLLLLAEKKPEAFAFTIASLYLTKADGFEGSVWADGGREYATKWVKDNLEKYRIKKCEVAK
jgi:hypothetical protein